MQYVVVIKNKYNLLYKSKIWNFINKEFRLIIYKILDGK